MPEMLSTKQTAEILGVSPRTVVLYVDRGHFPGAHKLDPTRRNSPIRIPLQDVEEFKARRQPAGEPTQPA